jgi:hypothetical protein
MPARRATSGVMWAMVRVSLSETHVRQTQPHDQGNPAGSIRSAAPHIHSAMVTVVRSVDLGCPSLEPGGQRHRHRRARERYIAAPVATRMPQSVAGRSSRRSDARLQPATEAYVGRVQDQEAVQQPKRNCRDQEQIHRRDAVSMIAQEGLPALRWWAPPSRHVFCDRNLSDVDAELE